MNSDFIPSSFKDYPIEKVYAILELKAEDLINREETTYEIEMDITDTWNNSVLLQTTNKNKQYNAANNISKDAYESVPALITDIYRKESNIYLTVDIMQHTDEGEIINQNPKLRTYMIEKNIRIADDECNSEIYPRSYFWEHHKEVMKAIEKYGFVIIGTAGHGEKITYINLGCWN